MRYVLNGAIEIGGGQGDQVELRCTDLGRNLTATRYQAGLLRAFDAPATIDTVLAEFPFDRASSSAFLDRCIDAGFLYATDGDGKEILPLTRGVSPTIFGVPPHQPTEPAAFTILGVPFDINTTGRPGTRFGPASIRAAAEGCPYTLDRLTFLPVGFDDLASGHHLLRGIRLADYGDVLLAAGEPSEDVYDRITRAVRTLLDSGTIPVVIGGDHSITYPILRAYPHDSLRVIHFDAHTDLGEVASTGLHHGNVFSMILNRLEHVEHVHQIGLRGVMNADNNERIEGVTQIGMDALRRDFDRLDAMIPDDGPCYLSIDIDVVDPAFAPSTGTPVPNGLFPHELKQLVHRICSTHEVVGMDVVEVGLSDDPTDGTAAIALEAIITACDGMVRAMQKALESEVSKTS